MPPLRCQNPDGTPTALATACQDKLGESDCKAIFAGATQAPAGGTGGTGGTAGGAAAPAMRPALCDNQGNDILLMQHPRAKLPQSGKPSKQPLKESKIILRSRAYDALPVEKWNFFVG